MNAEYRAENAGDDERRNGEQQRPIRGGTEIFDDGLLVGIGKTEIQRQHAFHVARVLRRQIVVQTEFLRDLFQIGRGVIQQVIVFLFANQKDDRVARHGMHQREADGDNQPDRRNGDKGFLEDVFEQKEITPVIAEKG